MSKPVVLVSHWLPEGELPRWQQELLGEEAARLGSDYCLIPDHVFTDFANATTSAHSGATRGGA